MKVDNEENLSDNIKKYNQIIQSYRNGEFGKKHLTLSEILIAANEPNLLNKMTISEIQYLCEHSSSMLKSMFFSLQKKKQSEETKLTVKAYLENIVNILNNETEKEYTIKCFSYPIDYELNRSHKDATLCQKKRSEGVIAITTKTYDIKDIGQEYLYCPEQHTEFFENGDFILCFGPDEKLLNFEQILQEQISDLDICECFYGLPKINREKILTYKK